MQGEVRQPRSSQQVAADVFAHEMDRLWGCFRAEAERVAADAIATTDRANDVGGQRWQNPNESLGEVQKAFVMRCFAMIDGLSQYMWGGEILNREYRRKTTRRENARIKAGKEPFPYASAQTRRMMSFMRYYMGVKPTVARLTIEIYRHMLMHEGRLHGVRDRREREYSWYVGWDASPAHHFSVRRYIPGHTDVDAKALVQEFGDDAMGKGWLVELGTLNLIRDVECAAVKYAAHLRSHESRYHAYLRYMAERWEDKLTWTPQLSFR